MDVMLTLDNHKNQIREDAQAICHPQFASQEDDQQHSTTSKAIEAVKEGMHELREMYQRLMSACQQKRELFIASVQFHMNLRQVCPYMYANLEPTASTYVRMTVCTYVVHFTYMYICIQTLKMAITTPKKLTLFRNCQHTCCLGPSHQSTTLQNLQLCTYSLTME